MKKFKKDLEEIGLAIVGVILMIMGIMFLYYVAAGICAVIILMGGHLTI